MEAWSGCCGFGMDNAGPTPGFRGIVELPCVCEAPGCSTCGMWALGGVPECPAFDTRLCGLIVDSLAGILGGGNKLP